MASAFDKASLVMLPNAYKDQKLYSVKPTDRSGDFTFSRDGAGASPATRVGADGLIEKGRENTLEHSNDLDQWDIFSGVTLTSGQSGYDGSSDAWLVEANSSAFAYLYRTPTTNSGIRTRSVYAKQGTSSNLTFLWASYGQNKFASFDLSNGTFTNANCLADIEDVGNGWYRCITTITDTPNIYAFLISVTDETGTGTTAGDNIYVQNAQQEIGLAATDYIETTTAPVSVGLLGDMPRLDYSGGSTCPSLLLEPSRTNLIEYSEYLGGTFTFDGVSMDYNHGTSPEGVSNSALLTQTGSAASNSMYEFGFPTTDGSYTYSIFFKAGTSTKCRFNCGPGVVEDFNPQTITEGYTGGSLNLLFENYQNGWWRASTTQTLSGASTNRFIFYPDRNNTGGNVEVWGAQVEVGSYPTSYIPTYGSSVLRGADNANRTGLGDIISDTEGTILIDFVATSDSNRYVSISGGSLNNCVLFGQNYGEQLNARIFQVYPNNPVNIGTELAVAGTRYRMAFSFGPSQSVLSINGTSITTNGFSGFAAGALTQIGYNNGTANQQALPGEHNQLLYFNTQLTESEMNTLTTL